MAPFRRGALAGAVFMCFIAPVGAVESVVLEDPRGVARMRIDFLSAAESPLTPAAPDTAWDFSTSQRRQMLDAMRYWNRTLGGPSLPFAANITILPVGLPVLLATSDPAPDARYSTLQAVLLGRAAGIASNGNHATIVVGNEPFSDVPQAGVLPSAPSGMGLMPVLLHELAHGLGVNATVVNLAEDPTAPTAPAFAGAFNAWTSHLRDDHGRPAQPGQAILCGTCANTDQANAFDVRAERGHFSGAQVSQVLDGAMPGVPVRMHYEDGRLDANYMSHMELKNSLMSHQEYRNYSVMMEAELAALQDMGYTIDRRALFGRSLYRSGDQLVNDAGFSQRNREGAGYLAAHPSTVPLAMGLHVYGSRNTIHQRADLLSVGEGAAGVRVDGRSNTLVIAPGTRVMADGAHGRGVLFAYGRDHVLQQRGHVQAMGEQGLALSFDFGQNARGNAYETRGSYQRTFNGAVAPLLDELDGPLMRQVEVHGSVAGRVAAIDIADNAYVARIDIMRGAALQGDIRSRFVQRDGTGAPRLTALNLGVGADGRADTGFAFGYDGNISGVDSISLRLAGGESVLSGNHALHDVTIDQGATLAGNGRYRLHGAGLFRNDGVVLPQTAQGRVVIDGHYRQGSDGTLRSTIDAGGDYGRLVVSGRATLDGTLVVDAQRGWYPNDFVIAGQHWVSAGQASGRFAQLRSALASPTLAMTLAPADGSAVTVRMTRCGNAYARHGGNRYAGVGASLDAMAAASPSSDQQALLAALDFSAADGSGVSAALRQLSPLAYGAMAAGILHRTRQLDDLVANLAPHATQPGRWRAFAAPFGGVYRQSAGTELAASQGSISGVAFGMDTAARQAPGWRWGWHGALANRSASFDAHTPGRGHASSLEAGLHARFAQHPKAGAFATMQARLGVEEGRVQRQVDANGYRAGLRGDWRAAWVAAGIGGGWRWPLAHNTSVAAVAGLDGQRLQRAAAQESGAEGARLRLASSSVNTLQARTGVQWRLHQAPQQGAHWGADLGVQWIQAWHPAQQVQSASLGGAPAFTTRAAIAPRRGLEWQAGVGWQGSQATLAAALSVLNRAGQGPTTALSATASWRF
ncbi:autotransporter domain-containing protein [Herbaspirillum sp. YR522]|uniref:autotransporter outer membrane beta-barrel domain-containing protein n=1 Tax=Herbaspirillum sp. YR522 TaxID=1144342 RepID=UPI00026FAAB3|nr:autotransporter outer membrane beta-barrel domain-containing protein [Herbaspirillum sp. YR522]EJN08792.1 hypothetical protein PMI40_01052 [Herbaspirillum sp. YR522]